LIVPTLVAPSTVSAPASSKLQHHISSSESVSLESCSDIYCSTWDHRSVPCHPLSNENHSTISDQAPQPPTMKLFYLFHYLARNPRKFQYARLPMHSGSIHVSHHGWITRKIFKVALVFCLLSTLLFFYSGASLQGVIDTLLVGIHPWRRYER